MAGDQPEPEGEAPTTYDWNVEGVQRSLMEITELFSYATYVNDLPNFPSPVLESLLGFDDLCLSVALSSTFSYARLR